MFHEAHSVVQIPSDISIPESVVARMAAPPLLVPGCTICNLIVVQLPIGHRYQDSLLNLSVCKVFSGFMHVNLKPEL